MILHLYLKCDTSVRVLHSLVMVQSIALNEELQSRMTVSGSTLSGTASDRHRQMEYFHNLRHEVHSH